MSQQQPQAYSRKSWDAVVKSMGSRTLSKNPVLATLYAEHRYMATLMQLLSTQLDELEQGEAVESHVLYESLHYMTHFPDAFHHPREDMVYQRAAERDPTLADSVDTLQREHDFIAELGGKTLRTLERWQAGELAAAKVIKPAREYIDAIYQHMNVEEQLVFPQLEKVLDPQDWRELEQEDLINPVADPVFGPRVEREYRNLARKARRALRRGVEDAALVEWIGLEALLEGYELLDMALDGGRDAARAHFKAALREAGELLEERKGNGGLLLVPWRFALNNAQHYLGFLRDVGGISKETIDDLAKLTRSARDRVKLVRSESPSATRH